MTRPVSRRPGMMLGAILVAWLATAALVPAQAASSDTFRDNFDSVSYSGSNGSAAWSGSWIESGEADGPGNGRVQVIAEDECAGGACGRLSAGSNSTAGIQRQANLDGATGATLSFSYRRTKAGGNAGTVRVSVSSNGGASWSTMALYTLDTSDSGQVFQSFNVGWAASGQTQVRFRVESVPSQSGRFHFDSVAITAEFPDPPTTTTTTTTTTTAPPPPTTEPPPTTTSPPTTSTTLPTSTTTLPTTTTGVPSTTSQPPSTTTTAPPPSPSTTVVPPPTTQLPPTSNVPPTSSAPPPFPIPTIVEAAAGSLGDSANLLTADGAVPIADPEVSSMVRLGIGQPILAASQHEPAAEPPATVAEDAALGAVHYVWPGLLLPVLATLIGTFWTRRRDRTHRRISA